MQAFFEMLPKSAHDVAALEKEPGLVQKAKMLYI